MADDWRLQIVLTDGEDASDLVRYLHGHRVEDDVRRRFGERLAVSRDDEVIFVYADAEGAAREAERLVRDELARTHASADLTLLRWHPLEERWEDPSVPMPQTASERKREHERREDQEVADSGAAGHAEWEVRIELSDHRSTRELAERLEGQGIPVLRRWHYLLVGATSDDAARALAERLRGELPAGARMQVEPSGEMVWEVMPQNPFAIFGGSGN